MSNIVGEGFDPYVVDQINARQAILGSINKSPDQLVWEYNKTSWIKLISSADVIDVQTKDWDSGEITNTGTFGGTLYGSEMAEKYVLFNGVSDESGFNSYSQRSGLDPSPAVNNMGAYGLGSPAWGFSPMPGILSATIKTESRGTLKTATVQIKANNKTQFDIINTLYLRLGYLMLLEWGNNCYFKDSDTFISDNTFSLSNGFLNGSYKYSNILDKIEEQRKESNGNYDAIVGKVVNFNWVFNKDGSYDITVILRSTGDIIESLKVNLLNPATTTPTGSEFDPNNTDSIIVAYAYSSAIGNKFANIQYQFSLPETYKWLDGMQSIEGNWGEDDDGNPIEYVDYVTQTWDGSDNKVEYYVRFGEFLDFLKKETIPEITNDGKLIDFDDVNSEDIIVYSAPRIIPSDPRIAIWQKNISNSILYSKCEVCTVTEGNNSYIKLMYVYFNFVFILKLIERLKDKEGKVRLIDLLNGLCDGFNKSTGNFNKVSTRVNLDTGKIVFIDEVSLPDRESFLVNPTTPKFKVYGVDRLGSFIRDIQLQTSITPELATMVTIGSTAGGYVTGQDATFLANLNKGTKPRIASEITSPSSPTPEQETQQTQTRYSEVVNAYNDFVKSLLPRDTGLVRLTDRYPKWNEDSFNQFNSTLTQLLEYDVQLSTKEGKTTNNYTSSPTSGFLPFNLNLVMDGLSGMKIYQKYSIDSEFLPENYPKTMEFIIKGISNSIQGNIWTTSIESVAIPKTTEGSIIEEWGTSVGVPFTPPEIENLGTGDYLDKTITSGFPLNPKGYSRQIRTKTQFIIHYSAGNQLSDKGRSGVAVLNKRGLTYNFIIDASGHVEQVIPDNYIAYHAGVKGKDVNGPSIGICLEGFGACKNETLNSNGNPIPSTQLQPVRLVDYNGNPYSHKGINWAQEVTDAQVKALKQLMINLKNKYPSSLPSYKWNGKTTFDHLFPPKGTTWTTNPGVYTHCSVTTSKVDVLPTPKLVKFFKELVL